MLPSVSTASSLIAASSGNGSSAVRFKCLSLPDVLPQLVLVPEIKHISISHCVDRMVWRGVGIEAGIATHTITMSRELGLFEIIHFFFD